MEKLAKQYSEENELSFLVLTEDELGGRDVVQYTEDFYDENAPGYDKKTWKYGYSYYQYEQK